jgi:hypothetical protein
MTEAQAKSTVSWRPLAGLLMLGLFLHVILVPFRNCAFWADEPRYLTEAYNLHFYGVISFLHTPNPLPTAMDTPLFLLLLSGLIGICESVKTALQLLAYLNVFFFIVAAAGVYRLVFNLRRDGITALLATTIFLFFPETFAHVVLWMPDAMLLMFLAWALSFFADYMYSQNLRALAAASALWAASVLTKPVTLYLGSVFLLAALWVAFRGAKNPWRCIMVTAVAATAGPLLLAPWMIRNYHDFHLVGVSSIVDSNPYYYNYKLLLEDTGVKGANAAIVAGIEQVHKENPASLTNQMLESRLLGQIAKRELAAHLGKYLMLTIRRHPSTYLHTGVAVTYHYLYRGDPIPDSDFGKGPAAWYTGYEAPVTWHSMSWPWKVIQILSTLFLLGAYLFACIGFIRLAKKHEWRALFLLGALLLYIAATIGPLADTRYRLPMLPALSAAAAIGCMSMQKGKSNSIDSMTCC